jgi:hypothetical protein
MAVRYKTTGDNRQFINLTRGLFQGVCSLEIPRVYLIIIREEDNKYKGKDKIQCLDLSKTKGNKVGLYIY